MQWEPTSMHLEGCLLWCSAEMKVLVCGLMCSVKDHFQSIAGALSGQLASASLSFHKCCEQHHVHLHIAEHVLHLAAIHEQPTVASTA